MNSIYKGKFKVTSTYGNRRNPFNGNQEFHAGLDLVGIDSKDIYSTINGIVEVASNADPNGFGTYIRIREDNTGHKFYFGHLSKVYVRVGQHVSHGEHIGLEGSTGSSTASHCHYEIRGAENNNISDVSGIPNKIGAYIQEEDNMTGKEAIDKLVTKGIVKSPEYWYGAIEVVKYLDQLFINIAGKV